MRRLLLLLILLLGSVCAPVRAQVITVGPDSTVVPPATVAASVVPDTAGLSRPAKAALWGLIPGGGQIYNHDYWKVPIVYAAVGGMAYSVLFANSRYREFARGYLARTDGDDATTDTGPHSGGYNSAQTVQRGRDFYRRNRDLSIIGTALVYGLSIGEALVDAHLATFSVSDDLTLRFTPALLPLAGAAPIVGLRVEVRSVR